jgi:hypothetical protein
MNDLACVHAFNGVIECREQRTIVFHSVLLYVNDDDSERQLLKIVLVLKAFVDGDQNVALTLSLRYELGVRESSPLGFRDSQNFMIGERQAQAGIDALV